MRWCNLIPYTILLFPKLSFCQPKDSQSSEFAESRNSTPAHHYTFMINSAAAIYTAEDTRINNFMSKYGYVPPQEIQRAIRLDLGLLPVGSRMAYFINGATVVSRQDLITADFTIGAYRRVVQRKSWWVAAGLSAGEHFDRIVLNEGMPPSFDSLAAQYGKTLSLHRIGLIAEPGAKFFWFPIQKRKFELGLFATFNYDVDLNGRWRLGYYPSTSSTFRHIKKKTNLNTAHEVGCVFSTGISICL